MEKIQLNYNELLRYTFSGGIGICAFLFLNPSSFEKVLSNDGIKDSIFLILLAITIGSLIYSIHRAIIYPICLKIVLILLAIFGKKKFEIGFINPLSVSNTEIEMDFKRWEQRQKEKSFSKNLVDWFAQIHFLYCTSWNLLIVILLNNEKAEKQNFWIVILIIIISIISHYRGIIYDSKVEEMDKKMNWK